MTPAAALALHRKAEASHKRADWRLACRALAEIVAASMGETIATDSRPESRPAVDPGIVLAAREPAGARSLSLCEFLSTLGGMDDQGGELASMDAGLWHMSGGGDRRAKRRVWGNARTDRAGAGLVDGLARTARRGPDGRLLGSLIRPGGMTLSDAAERAWNAGYFPDVPDVAQWMDSAGAVIPDAEMLLRAIHAEMRQTAIDDEPEPEPLPDDDALASYADDLAAPF